MSTINGKACVANGINLITQSDLKKGYLDRSTGSINVWGTNFYSDNYIATNGATVFTFSSPDYVFKGSSNHTLAMYNSDKNYLGYKPITSATQTLSNPNVAYIRFSINFAEEGGTSDNLSDWLSTHRYKLEKGSVATPLTPAPVDKVFSNGVQVYGRNLFSVRDWNANSYLVLNSVPYMNIQLEPNTEYTLTTNIGVRYDSYDDVFLFKDDETPSTPTGGVDSSSGRTLTTSSTGNVKVGIRGHSVSDGTNWIKLEKGSIATPWTPAPEDVGITV